MSEHDVLVLLLKLEDCMSTHPGELSLQMTILKNVNSLSYIVGPDHAHKCEQWAAHPLNKTASEEHQCQPRESEGAQQMGTGDWLRYPDGEALLLIQKSLFLNSTFNINVSPQMNIFYVHVLIS